MLCVATAQPSSHSLSPPPWFWISADLSSAFSAHCFAWAIKTLRGAGDMLGKDLAGDGSGGGEGSSSCFPPNEPDVFVSGFNSGGDTVCVDGARCCAIQAAILLTAIVNH